MDKKAEIEKVLEEKVRPMLRSHGGDIRLLETTDGVVSVELNGACAGCPSADLSTRAFVEETLKEAFSEISSVELHQPVSDDLLDLARKLLRHEEC